MTLPTAANGDHRAVVVGSGLAGLTVALELGHCTLVTRTALGDGASGWAQGGIAAAIGADDDPTIHATDTVAVSAGLADAEVARAVAAGAAERIGWLDALAVPFDRDGADLALGREAGHRRHRIVHAAGDATGAAVMARLRAAVEAREDITVVTDARAVDLLHDGGRVTGLALERHGRLEVLSTRAVVLATGGLGHLYARTTNPAIATGDGLAMALRAGVTVRDPEFVQFHPTALDTGADPLPLVTEALRGAGAVLRDDQGRRFLAELHPDAELAPRDVVARANFAAGQRGPVWLDATHLGPDIERRFPTVVGLARAAGLDPLAPLPVTPAQHYAMGGIATDLDGRTSLPGLFACGEVASTGLHGANRLASNSLLEAMVVARRVAGVLDADPHVVADLGHARTPRRPADLTLPTSDDPAAVAALRTLMWEHAGPIRDAEDLRTGLEQLVGLLPRLSSGADGRNLIVLAEVVLRTALARTESRGAHHRRDHPATDPTQARSTVVDAATAATLGPRIALAATTSMPLVPAMPGRGAP
ncbi:MAG: L-aspartate oxidase [Nitriliruptoraceae bacterium]